MAAHPFAFRRVATRFSLARWLQRSLRLDLSRQHLGLLVVRVREDTCGMQGGDTLDDATLEPLPPFWRGAQGEELLSF